MRNNLSPFELEDKRFINTFRLSKKLVHFLIECLARHNPHPNNLSTETKIFIFILCYGSWKLSAINQTKL